jgi:hypothetical protein
LGVSCDDAHAAGDVCAPRDRPILAEIFYDAAGDDSGHEFVELYNPTDNDWPIAGLRIEAGDGSGAGRWSLRWTGRVGDRIPARARFVVGGIHVALADAVASLDLQNGPDAVRLVWADGIVEVVGYGTHEFGEYACGNPAPDVASGSSLARIPDDANGPSNEFAFLAERPTPGRPNQVSRDAAAAPGTLALDPAQPEPDMALRARAAVVARGATALESGTVVASFWLDDRLLGSVTLPQVLTPAETAWVEVASQAGPAGKRRARIAVAAVGDEAPENDVDSLLVRVGSGPLEPLEIQFHPEHGEGEWIEIRNRSAERVELAAFVFADRVASGGSVDGAGAIDPESLGVVCQDRAALLAAFSGLDPSRVWEVRPWAALNNSDGADGFADVVRVFERDGTPCAQVPYQATGVPAGVPLERQDHGVWRPSRSARGSPLEPPRPLEPLGSSFEVAPRRVSASATVSLEWSLPWPRATVDIALYDLEGTFVGHCAVGLPTAARGQIDWRPNGIAPGVYAVSMVARSPDGASVSAVRALQIRGAP